MDYYNFRENNTGGSFTSGPTLYIIAADSPSEANDIAEDHGVYFDGCDTGGDCSCCGDRWYRASDYEASGVVQYYGIEFDSQTTVEEMAQKLTAAGAFIFGELWVRVVEQDGSSWDLKVTQDDMDQAEKAIQENQSQEGLSRWGFQVYGNGQVGPLNEYFPSGSPESLDGSTFWDKTGNYQLFESDGFGWFTFRSGEVSKQSFTYGTKEKADAESMRKLFQSVSKTVRNKARKVIVESINDASTTHLDIDTGDGMEAVVGFEFLEEMLCEGLKVK